MKCGICYGMPGKSLLRLHKTFITGCLGKKTEVEKGVDLDDLGRNSCGKIEA